MRTFIAIPLPEEVQHMLDNTQAQLRNHLGTSVGWTNPESIHLTLKFLGEVPENQIVEISKSICMICRETTSFQILCGGLGCFPNLRNPRVIWMGIQADNQLKELQLQLEEACEPFGFAREDRPFSPHLTLGRIKSNLSGNQIDAIKKLIESENQKQKIPIIVNHVNMYKSDLQRSGAKYTILKEAPLLPDTTY